MKAALMMMSTAIPWQPPPPHHRPLRPLCRSKLNGASSPSPSSQIKFPGGSEDADVTQPRTRAEEGAKESDIWRLFREAQKNIMHLNQHRLRAVEDLNKTNSEKQLRFDKIEQLEMEKQAQAFPFVKSICD